MNFIQLPDLCLCVVKMNTNNTTKRFIVGRKRTPTNFEATKELKEKLERFAEKKKEAVQALDKVILEKKILENWESEQVDVEDIRELVNQANFLELDCSRESLTRLETTSGRLRPCWGST